MKITSWIVCFLFFNLSAWAAPLPHDGFLRLYHSHSGEMLEVQYESNGKLNPSALKKINHFFRSRDSGQEIPIYPDLILLLDHLQDHFGSDTVEVICGYRTKTFNHKLRMEGHSNAEDSYHIRGMAADIHLDEIVDADIEKYLLHLARFGVGFYPDNLMVHVDVGPMRHWVQGHFTDRRNIGIFNPLLDLKITTDHLFYKKGQEIKLTLKQSPNHPIKPSLQVEWFTRGNWKTIIDKYPLLHPETPLSLGSTTLPFGKFRIKFWTTDGQWQNSNEFYVKR